MYFVEPTVPNSSAPQSAKRTAFFTSGELPSCTAVSSTAATPEPLSLMPGPSGTLSRCAPTTTTSEVAPVLVWAITLRALKTEVLASSLRVVGPGLERSSAPSLLVTPTTGILTSVVSPRVEPDSSPSTLFATMSATAPFAAAMACFSEKGQAPRSTSTTAPLTGRPS